DWLGPQAVDPGVEAGQGQQALDDLVHLLGAVAALHQQLAVVVGGARLAQGQLGVGQQGGQGGAQLVGDVGGRLLLAGEGALQLGQRVGEALGDGAQLGG